MERAVYQLSDDPTYGFTDGPEWGVDLNREDALYVLKIEEMTTAYHACVKSVLYDDVRSFEDALQREGDLPEGHYIVCYWWWDGQDLLQLADVDVTKEEIIENVRDQKYREGADYFLMTI